MAEAVAGLLTSAFVNIAKDKLGSAIAEQASLCWNFGDDLEGMKETLQIISAVLEDAERRSVKEKLVQLLLKRLKDVALDISDVLEDYQDTSDQASAKNPVLSCIPTAYKKIAIANRLKSLRKELNKIIMDFGKFNFNSTEGTSTTNVQHYDKFETTSHFLPEVEGREGDKQEIINLLLHARSNHNESGTVIVPIYALGGMGKTTLAQLVYNDEQFKKQYDCRHIWVYVSQDFNLLKIANSIISQVSAEGGQQNRDLQNTDLEVIMQCLDNLLCDKKVLIVLDDLWEKDDRELSKLKKMLHVGKKGSMIDVIVTTREEGIANEVSTSKPYKLQPLKDDVCWEIIKRSSQCDQKGFERIGLEFAQKCGGLPLAAQALGYILKTNKDIAEWEKINDSDIWKETSEDRVLPSLRLSYQKMPQQLRICFSYCAIFSKGHNIIEDDLIHHWSVLGFVEMSKGKEYIKDLLGMSFLQVSKMPSNSKKHEARYTMHDLVHDLAKLTMADQLKIYDVAPQRKTSANKYFRYSLLKKYDSTTKLENMPSKMRALRFTDNVQLNIRTGAFSFAMCLRILDFSECSGVLLPASIGKLEQLRCLIAPRMQNETLPKCIIELSKLQYLNLNQSQISALPDSVRKLGCLKYLSLSSCSAISKLPESFGDLKCMVHLDMSGCSGLTELPHSLGNLTQLQHLELSGCSCLKALPESLCGLKQLQYLNLSSCSCLEGLPIDIGSLVGIQHLSMSDCKEIREVPESMMRLQRLSHLNLSGCTGMWRGSLPCLRGLTALQHFEISSFNFYDSSDDLWGLSNNLKYLRLHDCIIMCYDFIATLTNLEYLDLSCNFTLECLPESIANLKRLHTLNLSYCERLNSLPKSIGTLGLKSLLVDGCSVALLDQVNSLGYYLQTLPIFMVCADEVNGCSNLHLLEGINVSELRIFSLENVKSLGEASKVKLLDKHNLSDLTLAWSTNGAVQFLDDQDLLGQLVPPRGLKSMRLEGYSSRSFPSWLMCIYSHLTNLVSIELRDMPTCSNLPPLGQLPHLENLELDDLPGIKRIDREFCGGNKGAFRRLSSFNISFMASLEEWNTTYSVEDGVEEFMFPVLDILKISQCPRLRLKPCPPTFRECTICGSDQVISSLDEVGKTSHQCSSSRAIKLRIVGNLCDNIRLFHHFPALQELCVREKNLKSLPESMRHLTSLESLTLEWCNDISSLPEWLGDLSSLKSLDIQGCDGIKSLPLCIQHLSKLQKLEIRCNDELIEWCELEENKAKLAHINNVKLGEKKMR